MNVLETFRHNIERFGRPIVVCQTGSHAYGLNTENSDEDYRGVFIPNIDYLIGLKTVEQVKVNGDDWVCHDIRQFVKLLNTQNPTIMELLFIEAPIFKDPLWDYLVPYFRGLIHRGAFKPYSAYVLSQLKKAQFRQPCNKRKELIEKYGYDVKFMSHVARLAVQCIFLMKEGYIPVKVPEPWRKIVLIIKLGQISKAEAVKICEDLDAEMHKAYKESVLPEKVDIEKFEREVYIPLMKELINE